MSSLFQVEPMHLFTRARFPQYSNPSGFIRVAVLQLCSTGTKLSKNQPRGINRHRPQAKVEVNAANLAKYCQRTKSITESLPCRFSPAEQGSIADDIRLVFSQIMNDEVPIGVSLVFLKLNEEVIPTGRGS
jgi:hypothetical protein